MNSRRVVWDKDTSHEGADQILRAAYRIGQLEGTGMRSVPKIRQSRGKRELDDCAYGLL